MCPAGEPALLPSVAHISPPIQPEPSRSVPGRRAGAVGGGALPHAMTVAAALDRRRLVFVGGVVVGRAPALAAAAMRRGRSARRGRGRSPRPPGRAAAGSTRSPGRGRNMRSEWSAVRPQGHSSPLARRQTRSTGTGSTPETRMVTRLARKVAASVVSGSGKRRHFAGSGGGGGSASRRSGPSTSGPGVTPGGVTSRVARGTTSGAASCGWPAIRPRRGQNAPRARPGHGPAAASAGALLARPDDPRDPFDLRHGDRSLRMVGVERGELDRLRRFFWSTLAITSPSRVLTTTRSPRRIGAAGETMMVSPSR